MKLLPRSLFGQIVLALVAGIVVAQLAGTWLLLDDRSRYGERLRGENVAQRIAGIISLLDEASAEERPRLVRALGVPPTRLSLDEPWQAGGIETGLEAEAFLRRVGRALDRPAELQVLSLRRLPLRPRADAHPMARHPERFGEHGRPLLLVALQVRLRDGAVVTFRHALPEPARDWPLRALGLLALLALSVALLAGWAVRRLTRPLAALADAADGLSRNLDQAPLPESGPQEVARAARSFNAMQRSLKSYLETRAQALAGVSHDLRLPLTRLRLRLEQLPEGASRAAMQRDIDEMDAMVGGTLDYLRAGADTEQAVKLNLNALVESLAEDAEAAGAKVSRRGTALPLVARPQALRRCLANLIDNARRYGGEVEVTLRDGAESVEIRIEDRGPGIPPAERERVFEPYVRLETSRARHTGGTGLGLAIARAIARGHGGEVTLEAREGGGLCASVTLPRR